MIRINCKLLCFVLLILSNNIIAQEIIISGEVNAAFKTNSFAKGWGLEINSYFINLKQEHLGITLSNSYMSSSYMMPDKNIESAHFILRDYTNITPWDDDLGPSMWDNAFEPIRLPTQTNRYYNFNFGLTYFHEFAKTDRLRLGTDLILTYRDQMEIAKVLDIKEIEIFGEKKYDYHIPIYAYDTYLDIGIAPFIQYKILNLKSMEMGLKTKMFIFPKSGEVIYNIGAIFSLTKKQSTVGR